jgi:uncharacterized membrane protein YqhA
MRPSIVGLECKFGSLILSSRWVIIAVFSLAAALKLLLFFDKKVLVWVGARL